MSKSATLRAYRIARWRCGAVWLRRPAECYRRRRAGAPCRDCGRLAADPRGCRARARRRGPGGGRPGRRRRGADGASSPPSAPDVAVVDIRMPPTHTDEGVRAAREIRRRFPGIGVLVLSQYAEPEYVVELLQDGASRDRLPAEGPDRRGRPTSAPPSGGVAAGGSALDPAVVELIVDPWRRAASSPAGAPVRHGAGDARARGGVGARAPDRRGARGRVGVRRRAAGRPALAPRAVPRGAGLARGARLERR